MEDQQNKSIKDISNDWLKVISDSLIRLESYERLMRSGCENIFEMTEILIQNKPENLKLIFATARINVLDLYITELDLLIENLGTLLSTKDADEMKKDLKFFNELLQKENLVYTKITNQSLSGSDRMVDIIFNETFYKICSSLSSMRTRLLRLLDSILFSKIKDNIRGKEI